MSDKHAVSSTTWFTSLASLALFLTILAYWIGFRVTLPQLVDIPRGALVRYALVCVAIGVGIVVTGPASTAKCPWSPVQRLEIVVMGKRNRQAKSSEVWVRHLLRPDGTRVSAGEFILEGDWKVSDGVPLAWTPATLVWEGRLSGDATLQLISHPWSGIAIITWNGDSQTVDLYSQTTTLETITLALDPTLRKVRGIYAWLVRGAKSVTFGVLLFIGGVAFIEIGRRLAVFRTRSQSKGMGAGWYKRLLATLVIAVGVGHLLWHWNYTIDDAFITFRYSSHLAHGFGLVFNPGQYVKGYSNTSWAVLMSLPELLGWSALYFSKAVGVPCFLVGLWLLSRYTRGMCDRETSCAEDSRDAVSPGADPALTRETTTRSQREPTTAGWSIASPRVSTLPSQLFSGFLMCISAPVAVWYVNGLETGFYTTLLVGAVLLRLREQRRCRALPLSGLLFAAVALSRPEGILFFGAMALHDVVYRIISRRVSLYDLCWFVVPPAAYALELLWSLAYYGDPFPNTAYAKVSGFHGAGWLLNVDFLRAVRSFAREFRADAYLGYRLREWGPIAIVALALLGLLSRRRLRNTSAICLMVCTQIAFIARVKGDWMPAARFMVPIIPFMILLLTEGLAVVSLLVPREFRRFFSCMLVVVVACFFISPNYHVSKRVHDQRYVNARSYLRHGRFFAMVAEPGRMLTAMDIGGIAYGNHHDVIDTAGLTDRFVARAHGTRNVLRAIVDYLTLLQPDIIRRHDQGEPDQTFYREALRSGNYLRFTSSWRRYDHRLLIRRDLVLVNEIPQAALRVRSARTGNTAYICASRFPEFVRPGQQIRGWLYWKRPVSDVGQFLPKRVFLEEPAGTRKQLSSQLLSTYLWPLAEWHPGLFFADYMSFVAPENPGEYGVGVQQDPDGELQIVGRFSVITAEQTPSVAQQLLSRVRGLLAAGRLRQAVDACAVPAALGHAEGRKRYADLAVCYAEGARTDAASLSPVAAIRLLNDAKFVLNRAAWDVGRASRELRRELDRVEAAKDQIIIKVLRKGEK